MATESWLWQSKVSIVANILKSLKNSKHVNNIQSVPEICAAKATANY